MTALQTAITTYLDGLDWPWEEAGRPGVVVGGYRGDNGVWEVYLVAREEHHQALIFSVYPEPVPQGRRAAVADLTTRVNYGLMVGNFEIDLDDGDLRYKTSLMLNDAELDGELMEGLLYSNVTVFDRYLPVLRAVIEEGADPAVALLALPAREPM